MSLHSSVDLPNTSAFFIVANDLLFKSVTCRQKKRFNQVPNKTCKRSSWHSSKLFAIFSLTYRLFTTRNNILLCFLFWITGLTISLPGLVGWTDNVYDHKMLECIWNRTHSQSYTIFFSSCVVFLPILVISFSHMKIYLRYMFTCSRRFLC